MARHAWLLCGWLALTQSCHRYLTQAFLFPTWPPPHFSKSLPSPATHRSLLTSRDRSAIRRSFLFASRPEVKVPSAPIATQDPTTTTSGPHRARSKPSSSSPSLDKQIAALGRQGRTDQALALYYDKLHRALGQEEALGEGTKPAGGPLPTIREVNAAIDACARSQPVRLPEAWQLYATSPVAPNVYTVGALMSACARAGEADGALELLRSLRLDHPPLKSKFTANNNNTFTTTTARSVGSRRWATHHIRPNAVVYQAAITACARADPPRVEEAWRLIERAQAVVPLTVVGYNAALAATARAGDWQRAAQWLERMRASSSRPNSSSHHPARTPASATESRKSQQATSTPGSLPAPDAVTYGTLLSACEKAGQWQELLRYAQLMQDEGGFALDGMAVTSVLHACQQLGLAQQALHYVHLLNSTQVVAYERQTAGLLTAHGRPPLQGPDAVAYRLAISACARGGAWQDGLRLLQAFHRDTGTPPDVVAYTAAMTGCEHAGEWKLAFALLDRMRQSGVQPNEMTFASVLGACAHACAKLLADQPSSSSTSSTSSTMIRSTSSRNYHGQTKDPDELLPPLNHALRLLRVLRKDASVVSPNLQVYHAALRACAEGQAPDQAWKVMEQLQRDGLQPTVITFGVLMTACERVGSLDGMSRVFAALQQHPQVRPNEVIYGAAMSCCRKAGDDERAYLLWRKMIQEGWQPNTATCNTVILAQTERVVKMNLPDNNNSRGVVVVDPLTTSKSTWSSRSPMDRALQVYKFMIQSMEEKSTSSKSQPNRQTYNLLVRALAENQQPREAESLLRRMRRDGLVPDVQWYTATVSSYERAGRPLQALRLMEAMREDGYDFYEVAVLNTAFKRAVKLANAVGQGWRSKEEQLAHQDEVDQFLREKDDDDDDVLPEDLSSPPILP